MHFTEQAANATYLSIWPSKLLQTMRKGDLYPYYHLSCEKILRCLQNSDGQEMVYFLEEEIFYFSH